MSNLQLVQTILDQSHLSPLVKSVQPVHSEFDHALRLYPLPTAVCRLTYLITSLVDLELDGLGCAGGQIRAIPDDVRGVSRIQPGNVHWDLLRILYI